VAAHGLELVVECAIGGLGWWMYVGSARAARGAARCGLGALVVLCALLTVMGTLAKEPPPSTEAMAAVSLATIGILSLLAGWLDRQRSPP
jgi:protein-S-isoprenylcysteine O-methyltransferase Ste14